MLRAVYQRGFGLFKTVQTGVRTFASIASGSDWKGMSYRDRLNSALAEDDPLTAEIAFYKGLALRKLGSEYSEQAITAFKDAAKLDPKFNLLSQREIASIYASQGKTEYAYEYLDKAVQKETENVKEVISFGLLGEESLQQDAKPTIKLP